MLYHLQRLIRHVHRHVRTLADIGTRHVVSHGTHMCRVRNEGLTALSMHIPQQGRHGTSHDNWQNLRGSALGIHIGGI